MILDNSKIPEISVVVLCYRAGESICQFVKELIEVMSDKFNDNYELILVGNYQKDSDDVTPRIVREIADNCENVTAITKPKEGMMGWDMRSGLSTSRGKNIAVIDGDNQMPIQDLIRVYDVLVGGNLDLAKTYRVERGDEPWRKLISFFYNLIFKVLFPGLHSRDINSKPKIITRQAYEKMNLVSDDWFIDAEMMIQARRLNFKIGEVSTLFRGLGGRRRSFVRLAAILEFIKNLVVFRIKEFKYRGLKK